ncbi:GH92 family glycosyl hydrolase [Zhouia sp. PK063]|uniref:GH92 family glycosyl hydrolase n=1 Tax=Zhouia sp. PK063 TaxID=3373602 RepID=UPI00379717F3
MNRKITTLLFCITTSLYTGNAQQKDPVDYVNTLQGTNSKFQLTTGNTYPTTALPFGMHTWTPQTGVNGDGWKYQYFKDEIRGFQQAHQCSSWTNDYAVFSLFPEIDSLQLNDETRGAKFSHDNETAKPNYYAVTFNNKIKTEIAPTIRGAHIRFSFPQHKKAFLLLDGYTGFSEVTIHPKEKTITGYVHNGRGFKKGYKSFFVLKFDKPFSAFGVWDNRSNTFTAKETEAKGDGKGAYIEFKKGTKVQVKVASSYISPEQAQLNLETELGKDKTVEITRKKAREVWNKQLSQIKVEGGTEEDKATFYSCFFRANLFSRKFYERKANGDPYYFSPYDGKVYDGYMYTDTGFWDTFRAQFPLNALIHPEMHGRYVNALLAAYDENGWLPSWSFPSEAGSMIGNHAISLFADAWAKGLHTFDPEKALKAYFHEATNKGPGGPSGGREGWKSYYTRGYVAYPETREATAKTLEYAYDDFCGYNLAKMIGDDFYASVFKREILNYKNVYNPNTGFMQGRDKDGNWSKNFDPIEWGGPFTEGNAWHWEWSVFHDINGLIDLIGGQENFNKKLDSVFTEPNDVKVGTYGGMIHEMTEMVNAHMGQYAHGNQPIQHMPYLYNYSGEPWKAQEHTREIMYKLYNSTENGYPGDEDQGQTSSWYVLSALGIYSVCPGTDQYVLGSPMFNKITITLENGNKFVIDAKNNSHKNVYIQKATLNGKEYTKDYLTYDDISKGGTFTLEMSDTPNKERGTKLEDRPYSYSNLK